MIQAKILHIVRHGKALQEFLYINDDDRPLIEKGILNNILVAKKLLAQYPAPDLIISSYAARALHTAHIFAREMAYPHEKVQAFEELYLHGDKEACYILENLSDDINSVMVVGHNPDVTYLANRFDARINEIRTSGVVTICFETDRWNKIYESKAKYTFFDK